MSRKQQNQLARVAALQRERKNVVFYLIASEEETDIC